jgi:putative membrane protein
LYKNNPNCLSFFLDELRRSLRAKNLDFFHDQIKIFFSEKIRDPFGTRGSPPMELPQITPKEGSVDQFIAMIEQFSNDTESTLNDGERLKFQELLKRLREAKESFKKEKEELREGRGDISTYSLSGPEGNTKTLRTPLPLPDRLLNTLSGRWYVFVFLAVYLFIALHQIGLRRTIIFSCIVWLTAFTSEYLSIRGGFPYGAYEYLPDEFAWQELWLGTEKPIPFFDSLSYTFLNYTGYASAMYLLTPRLTHSWNAQLAATRKDFRSIKVLLLGAALTMMLDVIIDPIALRGDQWFLGKIYQYPDGGTYFGVPLSNFAGWFGTSAAAVALFMAADWLLGAIWHQAPRGGRYLPAKALWAPGLWMGIAAFQVTMTFIVAAKYKDEAQSAETYRLAVCSTAIALLFLWRVVSRALSSEAVATPEERAAHFGDFPDPDLARRLGLPAP